MPSIAEMEQIHARQRWDQLDEELRGRIVQSLLRDPTVRADLPKIRDAIARDPLGWFTKYHGTWGMSIRNLLRVETGIGDEELPTRNWDDYYVVAVEEAVKAGFDDPAQGK